jgi:hypothetical protein
MERRAFTPAQADGDHQVGPLGSVKSVHFRSAALRRSARRHRTAPVS